MDQRTEELERIMDEMLEAVKREGVVIKHVSDRGAINLKSHPLLFTIKSFASELRLRGAKEGDMAEDKLRELFE